jgi:hypothetical protein
MQRKKESESKKSLFGKRMYCWRKLLLKESIADLAIQEHYEQRFLDLEYIFQQDRFGSNISDSKNLEL